MKLSHTHAARQGSTRTAAFTGITRLASVRLVLLFCALCVLLLPDRAARAALPAGWSNTDIGFPDLPGSASWSAGNWTVSGAGNDIWSYSDQFHFAYYGQLTNYSVIIARVTGIEQTDLWAKAGVMFRESMDPSSPFAMVVATAGNGASFQWRPFYASDCTSSTLGGVTPPYWVKLVRVDNQFSGYYSPDGAAWTPLGPAQIVTMYEYAPAGLAVTSHAPDQLNSATFSNVIVSNTPPPPPPPPIIFGAYRELWTDLYSASGTLRALTNTFNNPNWPDFPTTSYTKTFTNLETELDLLNYYGQRVRTFVIPPTNGNYTFWIASDDNSELYLSTDEQPTNKVTIAAVPGFTSPHDWTKYPNQQSAAIPLEGGRRYYLEALMAEGSGGDHLTVRWQLPDANFEEPLPAASPAGTRLVPFDGVDARPGIYQQTTNMTLVEGQTARFSVLVTNKSPVSYQWTLNSLNISNAIKPFHVISNVTVAANNGQVYRCMLTNSAGWTNSTTMTLTVIADTVRPTVVRTLNVGTTNVSIVYSEPVEAASATNRLNYVFTNGLNVVRAVLGSDNATVTLTTAPMVYGSNYSIVINGVRDRAAIPNTILAGTTVRFTAMPYALQEVGNPPIATVITVVSNGVNVTASGNGVGGFADQFGFGYSLRTGNFDVAARVAGLTVPHVWAKAGLMAREGMESGARFAAAFATPAMNGCFLEWRDPLNSSARTAGNFPANYPYTWLRLKRAANTFTAYAGYDGLNWTELGSTIITMPSQVYFGLAVSSHNPAETALAQVRDIVDVTNAVLATVANPREPLGPSSRRTPIVISEIMYKPAPRTDTNNLEFIEIYNSNPWFHDIGGYQLVGENLSYTFPPGTTIRGGSFLVIAASPQNMQAVYGITNVMGPYTGTLRRPDKLQLFDEQGALLMTIAYNNEQPWPVATDGTGHSLVLGRPTYGEADPRAWDTSDALGGSPGQMDPFRPSPLRSVVINEYLAHTDPPELDYVELYNHGNQPVNISGCIITDEPETNKFVIPQNTTIPARGFVSFTESTLNFRLDATGEQIFLKSADQTRFIDAVEFGAQENGVASGRWPDGAADFYRLAGKTPGTNNASVRIHDLVINEIMYHPLSEDDDEQYVEIYNRGTSSRNLGGWQLSDGISFTFPSNTVLAADSYLVIARDAAHLRSNYANLNVNNCIGNFDGRLAYGGERVALRFPDTIISTNNLGLPETNLVHIAVAEVTYSDGGRWGQWADGGGSSLELVDPRSNARLAANWADSDETQKSSWANIEVTGLLDNGHNYETAVNRAQLGLLEAGECLVDNIEVRDGVGPNLVLNSDFETGLGNWSMQGDHARSSIENVGYAGSSRSLHIRASDRMWTGDNSCQMNLAANGLGDGSTGTLRFKARWLRGWPEVLLRVNGNWLEATGRLPVPANLGTPGARNSRYLANVGPAVYAVTHTPPLPAVGQAAVVTARVHDPNGLGTIQLFYRLDPTIVYTPVTMRDDGTGGDEIMRDGIYSATIPGQPLGTIAAFYIQAQDTSGATTRFPALRNNFAAEPECLVGFGDADPGGSFAVYHFWVTETNSQRWYELSSLSNEQHDGTMVCGSRVIYNVSGRFVGSPYHQDFNYPDGNLCHYKWSFPNDDRFMGGNEINKLHQPGNGAGDDSALQREQIANTLLRTLGVPWLNRRFVVSYVNGTRRGTLMEDIQKPDGDIVEQYFPDDPDGWLYKMQPWFEFGPFPQGINIPFVNASWCNMMPYTTTGGAKKTARYRYMFLARRTQLSASDYTNVFSMVDAASSYGSANYAANMENLADMENWMRVFAANHASGNWDAYGLQNAQNVYGYIGRNGTRYSLLMYDFNIVFGNANSWGPGQNLFSGNSQDPNTLNIYNEPKFRRMYWRALQELVNGPFDITKSGPLMDAKYDMFAMNGLSVENPNSGIKPWLTTARDSIAAQLSGVNASSFTLNSTITYSNNIAFLTGTAPVNVRSIFINGAEYPITWTSLTAFRVAVPLQQGSNPLSVVGVDMNNQPIPGTSNNIAPVYSSAVPSPVGQVVINEIMYEGLLPGAEYVELFNNSSNITFDLSNWEFRGLGYTFPAGSFIRPRSYLILAANAHTYAAAYGAVNPPFDVFNGTLQTDGETLTLIKPGVTELIVDKIRYGNTPPWPTAANVAGTSLQLVDLRQDHWRVANWAAPSTNMTATPQWVYVSLVGTANSSTFYMYLQSAGDIYLDDVRLVSGTTPGVGVNLLANGNFESAFPGPWTVGANHAGSTLSTLIKQSGAASLHLVASLGGSSPATAISQTVGGIAVGQPYSLSFWYLQSPHGGPLTVRLAGVGLNATVNPAPPPANLAVATPGALNSVAGSMPTFPPLWINELQAENVTGITNSAGQHTPWIELYNPTTSAVSLNGLFLANNYTNLTQWAFPSNAVINPGQFKVIFTDGQTQLSTLNELHTSFSLPTGAGTIALSRLTTNAELHVLDYVGYTNLTPNRSYGSLPDAQIFARQEFFYVTAGATNNGVSAPLTVRINEWMAQNSTTLMDPADDNYEDWFELHNYGNTTVDLFGYYLADSITNRTQYRITGHYLIPPRGFLLVWADDETQQNSTNRADLHVNFKLSVDGEVIGLFGSDGSVIDIVEFGPQANDVSMGRIPDGGSTIGILSEPSPRTNNAGNMAPNLEFIADRAVFLGQTLSFYAGATDSDQPSQTLSFSLAPGAPAGAAIDSASGLFTWTPATAPLSASITIVVTDNGTPPLNDSQAFTIQVYPPPGLTGINLDGSQFSFGISTVPGHTYQVQYCENLGAGNWVDDGSAIAGTGGIITIPIPPVDVHVSPQRYYRVKVQ